MNTMHHFSNGKFVEGAHPGLIDTSKKVAKVSPKPSAPKESDFRERAAANLEKLKRK